MNSMYNRYEVDTIKLFNELIYPEIGRMVFKCLETGQIDYEQIAAVKSMQILEEIKNIIHNEKLSDFAMADEITEIFIKYNIDIGGCHDF